MDSPNQPAATSSTPPAPVLVDPSLFDADNTIAQDLSCRRCGYNLRGLPGQGRCPECGVAVGLSTFGNFLRFAEPDWVDKIALGALLLLWGIVVQIAGSCTGGLLPMSTSGLPLGEAIMIVASILGIIGPWLLSARDPGMLGDDKVARARTIMRAALIVNVVLVLASLGLEYQSVIPIDSVVLRLIGFVSALASLTAQYYLMVYVEYLFSRVPEDKLASRTRTLRWGFMISLGLLLVAAALGGLNALGGQVPEMVVIVPAATGGILIVICSLLFILTLLRLRRALRLQAESARATWALRQWQPPAAPVAT